jgi:hypothetical protein
MKKILVLLAVVFLTVSQLFGQNAAFQKGDKLINLTVGLPYLASAYHMVVPPVVGSFELGIVDGILKTGAVGVGGYVGYSSYNYRLLGSDYGFSNLMAGVRGAFHYTFVDKLDTYTGILLGYSFEVSSKSGIDYANSPAGFDYDWFVGARYYFSNNFAVMAELGYGISWLNAGISFKF